MDQWTSGPVDQPLEAHSRSIASEEQAISIMLKEGSEERLMVTLQQQIRSCVYLISTEKCLFGIGVYGREEATHVWGCWNSEKYNLGNKTGGFQV